MTELSPTATCELLAELGRHHHLALRFRQALRQRRLLPRQLRVLRVHRQGVGPAGAGPAELRRVAPRQRHGHAAPHCLRSR